MRGGHGILKRPGDLAVGYRKCEWEEEEEEKKKEEEEDIGGGGEGVMGY